MKLETPVAKAADLPPTRWGKILTSTPVVMTVVATLLAGLSNSEMTRAQYDRSLAAQQQSKAGDQWSLFQAKRLRGTLQQSTLDALELTGKRAAPLPSSALREALASADTGASASLDALISGQLPEPAPPVFAASIQSSLVALVAQQSEKEILKQLEAAKADELAQAVQDQKDAITQFDRRLQPILQGMESLSGRVPEAGAADGSRPAALQQNLLYSKLTYSIRRYDAESRLNQTLANLYELQVRKSNLSADHHYTRSQRFFFGMLAAQLSVLLSTFAMAVRLRSVLWTMAAVIGLFAIALAGYVYLWG